MDFNKAGKKSHEYHCAGFHCAEAVSKSIIEIYSDQANSYDSKIATPFGGGVGLSKQEMCGALSGGLIALGYLYGRSSTEGDMKDSTKRAAKFRDTFIQKYGTTNCGSLLAKFGTQENMMRCKQLSGEVAHFLSEMIKNEGN